MPRAKRCSRTSACPSARNDSRGTPDHDDRPDRRHADADPQRGDRATRRDVVPDVEAEARDCGRAAARGLPRLGAGGGARRASPARARDPLRRRWQAADRRHPAREQAGPPRVRGQGLAAARAQRARRRRDLHLARRALRQRGARAQRRRRADLRGLVGMSRIGNKPVAIPSGVTVEKIAGGVRVKGPKGTLTETLPAAIQFEVEGGEILFRRPDETGPTRALHGLARALVANMVTGVVKPFAVELEIQGVGYRAEMAGKKLSLLLGFSHPIEMAVPEGLSVSVDRNVIVRVEGIDRRRVGQFAADIRALRPPEPYKGKGIRYVDEHVRRKVGKAAAGAAG